MDDLRALIASEAVAIEELAARKSVSVHTIRAWIRGAVPQGAPSFPPPVKVSGKILKLYCYTECSTWIDTYRHTPGA